MHRRNIFLVIFLFGLTALLYGQDSTSGQQSADSTFNPRQLIAWSSLQKPHPVPQPLPPPDTPVPQPDPPNASPKPANPQTQQAPAQTFVGKISKSGNGYVLQVTNDTEYKLAGADASRYDNQNVKVTGQLEQASKTIHVISIKLVE